MVDRRGIPDKLDKPAALHFCGAPGASFAPARVNVEVR
jgi:hypothetical protein